MKLTQWVIIEKNVLNRISEELQILSPWEKIWKRERYLVYHKKPVLFYKKNTIEALLKQGSVKFI